MKTISRWASSHSRFAISLIIFLQILLGWLCYQLGILLTEGSWRLPAAIIPVGFAILLLLAFGYPHQQKLAAHRYAKRKLCDVLIILIGSVCLTATVNRMDQPPVSGGSALAFTRPPTADAILHQWKTDPSKKLNRSEKRILRKEFTRQLKQLRQSIAKKDMDATGRVLLIIFTIIMALGAAGLIAALVCSLSCNGSAFAATAVALLGGVGLILGTIFIIKAINRKYRKSATNQSNTNK